MQFSLYKPNSKSTGCAFQFNVGKNNNKKGGAILYLSGVQQASWNEKTRTGSFSANAKNPEKTINTKLNKNEIGAILYAIRVYGEFSTFHTYADNKTTISLKPYQKNDGKPAFSFSVNRNGNQKFGIGIEMGEAEALCEFLKFALSEMFLSESYNPEGEYAEE